MVASLAAPALLCLLSAIPINEEQCAWRITDADHYQRLSWQAKDGDAYMIGVLVAQNLPDAPLPLFLKPPAGMTDPFGAVGHAMALSICAPVHLDRGNLEEERFCVVWSPARGVFLLTFEQAETLEEVRRAYDCIQKNFLAGVLYYWPLRPFQIQEAESWPAFTIPLILNPEGREYVAYALGRNCGRLRPVRAADWPRVRDEGALGRQDIVLLEEAPLDFAARIAGAITSIPQAPLSHVNLICLQESTPNAYAADAWERLAPYFDKLVSLEVLEHEYRIREASPEEAERVWAAKRPAPIAIAAPDAAYRELPSIEDLAGTYRADRFGGKGAHLARFLPSIPEENRVPGFVIPFAYFAEFLDTNFVPKTDMSFREYAEYMFAHEGFLTDSSLRRSALARFRGFFEDGDVPRPLIEMIAARIEEVFGSASRKVRFRSSSNAEDALLFPGAGLYDSTSACAADSLDGDNDGPCRCDPDETDERTIGRALRRIWASLWEVDAVEQRLWHGVREQDAHMAILVTPAFLDEGANGVALTGSPTDPADHRSFITAQIGEAEVVRPEPGEIPEVDVVAGDGEGGFTVIRGRASNLVPAGDVVLRDEELISLGRILDSLAASYRPPEPFPSDLVRLDVEFKVTQDRKVSIKQVRPYCLPGTPALIQRVAPRPFRFPSATFVNAATGDIDVASELAGRRVLRLAEQAIAFPMATWTAQIPWIARIARADPSRDLSPSAPAEIATAIQIDHWLDGIVQYTWSIEQAFGSASGETVRIAGKGYRLRLNLWQPEDPDDEEIRSTPLLAAYEGTKKVGTYVPLAGSGLSCYRLAIDLREGGHLDLYRLAPSADGATGAVLIASKGRIGETSILVDDPFRLAIGDGPSPIRTAYLAACGADPIPILRVEFRIGTSEPAVSILEPDGSIRETLEVAGWSQKLFHGPQSPLFVRGDVDGDGAERVQDALGLLEYLFASGAEPACPDAADANDDGALNISDPVTILRQVFAAGATSAGCVIDETPDALPPCGSPPWVCADESP
ncbi:MAG: hypothetical protein JXP34_02610 [Planctomycetes bacterium]|nr:hypothetical protein [Planctomycetota bacterium]